MNQQDAILPALDSNVEGAEVHLAQASANCRSRHHGSPT
jgi:hypothetical protein